VSSFVDESGLHVKAGDGGAGCVSFRREAHVQRGGPDGGDGGDGGDVWLVADHNIASLLGFADHPHREAESGTHGKGKKKHGANGRDLEVPVPVGTVVREAEGTVLADLVNNGDRWLAGRGGRGGRGNASFLSNRRRAPAFAEQGEVGEERWLRMELKLFADVALVGFPNVGKSTLISVVSAATPKIADYPFTTLVPNLGVVKFDDLDFVVADIPGLIEGAAEGKGLGHQFLRHVERARVLVLLLDHGPLAPMPPEEQHEALLAELGRYQSDLLERPRIVVGSKADLADTEAERPHLMISAPQRRGIDELTERMAEAVAAARRDTPDPQAYVVHRPDAEGFKVERLVDGSFEVTGRQAIRAVSLSDLSNADALDEAHRRLDAAGINKALARAGAHAGDTVVIGAIRFDFEDEETGS
jgi:GTP-binding protein